MFYIGTVHYLKNGIFPLVEANKGNEWNDFIEDIHFEYLSSSMSLKTDGKSGYFAFELLLPNVAKLKTIQ